MLLHCPERKIGCGVLPLNKFVRKLFTVLFAACELYKGTAMNKCFFQQTFEIEENFSQAVLQVGCCAVALPRAKIGCGVLPLNKFVRKLFTVLFAACELYKGTAMNKCFFQQTFEIEENFSQAVLQVGCCAVALPRAKIGCGLLPLNKFVRKLFTVLFTACELYKGTATSEKSAVGDFIQT